MATDLIGNRLSKEMGEYGIGPRDLQEFLDVTPSAITNWKSNKTGINYFQAQKVAFLFGLPVDELRNDGHFTPSPFGKRIDPVEFARHIMDVFNSGAGPRLKHREFIMDVKSRALVVLENTHQEGPKPGRLVPVPHAGPQNSCDVRPAPVPESPDDNQIKLFLQQAEKFRQNTDLEWHVDDSGRLRARRVTTVEF